MTAMLIAERRSGASQHVLGCMACRWVTRVHYGIYCTIDLLIIVTGRVVSGRALKGLSKRLAACHGADNLVQEIACYGGV